MSEISTKIIAKAVYKLCFEANTCLDNSVYSKILTAYKKTKDEVLKSILQNAKIAYDKKLPLCQDTGQVIVFVELGQDVKLTGNFLEDEINSAIKKCYIKNFFRKSVVKNSVFDRTNTKTNTPAIIYTKIVKGEEVNIKILIKGAGSENKSKVEMMLPTSNEQDIISSCKNLILQAGTDACPPMFIGIGIGGTLDKATILSKEVFVQEKFSKREKELAQKIKEEVNKEVNSNYILDVKLSTLQTHIACMPVAITINCHSDRVSSCTIKNEEIIYHHKTPKFMEFKDEKEEIKEVLANDIKAIKNLKQGEKILLTGEIYIARDMAHKRLKELIDKNEELPFCIKDKIIFYAGPCPNKKGEVIGSVGPTTSSRMDKYAVEFYNKGLLATIGKGERNQEVKEAITNNNAKYFTVTGGIAAMLANKVKSSEIIAFNDLGAEALYKIYIVNFPLTVAIS